MTKSKQISKIIVATCSQGLYGVIELEYADSEYDTTKIVIYIYLLLFCLHVTKSKQLSNIFKLTRRPKGAFCGHIVFAAGQPEQAKRASINEKYNNNMNKLREYILLDKQR